MMNTYIKSDDEAAIREFCAFFTHVIGPSKGVPEGLDEDENPIPAKGDPDFWYACIRGPVQFTPDSPILPCQEAEGIEVVGVWA